MVLTGCFKELSYDTTIVIRPKQQVENGGNTIELPGVVAYAFAADTTDFEVTSFENAMAGIMLNKETGEEISAIAKSTSCDEYNNAIALSIDSEIISIVAIDTLNEDYGYTTYKVGVNVPKTYMSVTFAPWKEGKFKYGNWYFVVDKPYEPEIPEVEVPEVEEPEVPEVEVPETENIQPDNEETKDEDISKE